MMKVNKNLKVKNINTNKIIQVFNHKTWSPCPKCGQRRIEGGLTQAL